MSPTHSPSPDDQSLLASKFAEAQRLDDDKAAQLAQEVLGGPEDIGRAALAWAASGVMPPEPHVAGETPKSLAERFAPSQVFTGLILLRRDPHTGARVVRRGVDRRPAPPPREAAVESVAATRPSQPAARRHWAPQPMLSAGGFVRIEGLVLVVVAALALAGVVSPSAAIALAAILGALLAIRAR